MGTCRYCNQNAGFLRRQHGQCRDLHAEGIQEMTQLAAQAAGTAGFNETAFAQHPRGHRSPGPRHRRRHLPGNRGWLGPGRPARHERRHPHPAGGDRTSGTFGTAWPTTTCPASITGSATLDRASADRISTQAGRAALATGDGGAALQELDNTLRRTSMSNTDRRQLLVRAWETAVEKTLEDGLLTLDEESALHEYLDHFGLTQEDLNANGAQTTLVQAAVIREVTQGIIPQRQNISGRAPFNLMKSEQLVWVIQGVDYLETVVRRERQGTSHGVSIRVAKGLYYSPRQFRSRPIEWEETVHADTGTLGLTTKHVYFAGSRKKFRVRYDRIVSFEPYDDGFGIMRDAQTAKPQTFRTGDGWFPYNLVVNLAQMQG